LINIYKSRLKKVSFVKNLTQGNYKQSASFCFVICASVEKLHPSQIHKKLFIGSLNKRFCRHLVKVVPTIVFGISLLALKKDFSIIFKLSFPIITYLLKTFYKNNFFLINLDQ